MFKRSVSSVESESTSELEEEDGGTSRDSSDGLLRCQRGGMKNSTTTGKRNRTTILPEQQDYLLSQYAQESNPSRKMLEEISGQVKLKKRVVQVWFQNTRARERKGNIKIEHSHPERKRPSSQPSFTLNEEMPLDLSKSSRLETNNNDDEEEEEERTRRRRSWKNGPTCPVRKRKTEKKKKKKKKS